MSLCNYVASAGASRNFCVAPKTPVAESEKSYQKERAVGQGVPWVLAIKWLTRVQFFEKEAYPKNSEILLKEDAGKLRGGKFSGGNFFVRLEHDSLKLRCLELEPVSYSVVVEVPPLQLSNLECPSLKTCSAGRQGHGTSDPPAVCIAVASNRTIL